MTIKRIYEAHELPQGTPEWHEFRAAGVGASEASAIMGENPHSNAIEIWQRKLNLIPPVQVNAAMQRGHELEPIARTEYELLTGNLVTPKCYVHPQYDFIRASLDGITEDGRRIVEIKCPGVRTHQYSAKGQVPPWYYAQLQQQLACTGAEVCDYYSYMPETGGILIEIEPDLLYIERLIERVKLFWSYIESRTEPPREVFCRPAANSRTDMDWEDAARLWRQAKSDIAVAEAQERTYRRLLEQMVERGGHNRVEGGGVRAIKMRRTGIVDYKRIPELKGVDLDAYRNAPTNYIKLTPIE